MGRERHGSGANRVRLAAGTMAGFAALVLLLPFAAAGPARAATVTCPTAPLLAEEIERAGSVFVGQVRGPAAHDATDGIVAEAVAVVVEEIWRGPELAPTVDVSNPAYAGAPRVVLETGGRYLFLAEPATGTTDGPVDRLMLRECSLTRPLAANLAGLRPTDALVMPGFAPTDPDSSGGAPIWPWALAGLLVVATAATFLLRDRIGPRWAWLPWTAGLTAAAAVVLGVFLTVAPPSETASASSGPSLATSPSMESSASPTSPLSPPSEDPTLVARITEASAEMSTWHRVVSIHADGRVISSTIGDTIVEQWLSESGLDAVRNAVAATGLLGLDAAGGSFRAVLRPGAESPQSGAYGATIVVPVASGTASLDWTPIPASEAHLWQPSPEITQLDALAEQLWDLDAWLEPAGWLRADARPFEAVRFRLSDEEIVSGYRPEVALTDVGWPLTPPLAELPAFRTPAGLLTRCLALSRGEAGEVLGALGLALDDPGLQLTGRFAVELAGGTAGRVHRLALEPLLPDEAGCPGAMPVAGPPTLAAGVIALVRVEGLRMREAPGPDAAIGDALGAGEHVAVVTESVAADGSRWWLVRQGPGDRQGWVSAGPADGDPWLVAVGNGLIAVSEGNERILTVSADGSGTTTIADASQSSWSPDGTRILLSVHPLRDSPDWQIAIANADGSGQRRIGVGDTAAWSPDGSRIAVVFHGENGPAVYVMDADGSGAAPRVADGWQPAWSPDGSALAVWRPDLTARPPSAEGYFPIPEALWIVELDGGGERQVTPYEVLNVTSSPAWSPDGELITFGDRLIQTDGSEVLRLDRGDTWAERPWSPDGEDLIVVDTEPDLIGSVGISLLAVDTGELRPLVPAGDDALGQVTWSPDGRFLAYTAVRFTVDGNLASMAIRLVPVAGGEVTDLGLADSQSPTWQPVVAVPLD